eukprot:1156572-Pelagomonas_calceolata.AAC.9
MLAIPQHAGLGSAMPEANLAIHSTIKTKKTNRLLVGAGEHTRGWGGNNSQLGRATAHNGWATVRKGGGGNSAKLPALSGKVHPEQKMSLERALDRHNLQVARAAAQARLNSHAQLSTEAETSRSSYCCMLWKLHSPVLPRLHELPTDAVRWCSSAP